MYFSDEENEIFCVLNKIRKLAIRNTSLPISHVEFMVLHTIFNTKNKQIKISDLAYSMEVSTPAISKMLRNLEEKKFIIRINDANDRRVTYAQITEQGQKMLAISHKIFKEFADNITEKIGIEKIEELKKLLTEVSFFMSEELQKHPINIDIDSLNDKT